MRTVQTSSYDNAVYFGMVKSVAFSSLSKVSYLFELYYMKQATTIDSWAKEVWHLNLNVQTFLFWVDTYLFRPASIF